MKQTCIVNNSKFQQIMHFALITKRYMDVFLTPVKPKLTVFPTTCLLTAVQNTMPRPNN